MDCTNCFSRKISTNAHITEAEICDGLSALNVQEAHATNWSTVSCLFYLRQLENRLCSIKKNSLDENTRIVASNYRCILSCSTQAARARLLFSWRRLALYSQRNAF